MNFPVYAKVGENFQQVGGDCPSGYILMVGARPEDDRAAEYVAMADGTWAIDPMIAYRAAVEIETAWRSAELLVVADQLLRIEDGDPAALSGNDRQWRDYRIQLRAWAEGADHFPDAAYRPVRPVAA
ncbi:hypothetical protein CS390_16115 [Pseudomonas sp. HLS-6]|uniref:hypothetical protein n=1 Tax=Pseudomonas sp. HLS-6 TaxID=2049589 RepID=UPI000C1A74C9|nr:hypothetical protein [Pseudomonas sp. HLS-6]ATR83955.1 hypothetical protein CS390_16115 [Pseudomonas sp. HLS-6]